MALFDFSPMTPGFNPAAPNPMQQQGIGNMGGLLGNPLLNIGLGILANNYGNYGNLGAALGRGAQQGIQNTMLAQQQARQQQLADLQVQQAQAEMAERQKRQGLISQLPAAIAGREIFRGPFKSAKDAVAKPNVDEILMQIDPIAYYQSKQKDKTKPVSLGKGERLVDPETGKVIIEPIEIAEDLPSSVQEYNFAKQQGYKGSFRDWTTEKARAGASSTSVTYGAPVAGVDAQGNPVFFQPAKGGGAPAIIPGVAPAKTDKAPTEMQAKAGTFYNQMTSANKELGALSREGYDPTTLSGQVGTAIAGGITNPLAPAKAQQARQAQEQWAESFLRVKTGAAATQGEVDRNVRTFFPQIGDTPEVIQQKARARQQAEQDVLEMASPQKQSTISGDAPQKQRSKQDILKQYGVR